METFVIVLLALLSAFLGWKLWRLQHEADLITDLMRDEDFPGKKRLPHSLLSGRLAPLSRSIEDALTESALEHSVLEERSQVLCFSLDQIEDALFVVDGNLDVLYSNRAARDLFPGDHDEAGYPLIEACLDHRIVEVVRLAMESGDTYREQMSVSHSRKILQVEAGTISSKSRLLDSGAWVLLRDISVQVSTEQMRKDFVANASHELRTPLSIISGHLEMMDEEVDNRIVRILKKNTDRISRLVEDMLTISKLESGNGETASPLQWDIFDIGQYIDGVVEHLQPMIEEQSAKVHVDVPEDREDRFVYGDAFYFEQIILNLVENALKQNPGPGLKVVVKVTRVEPNDGFLIEVCDNGIGIPAADLSAIFKRFYRVAKHHSQNGTKGTGLGLSIVKRAVEAHHGTISVASVPGVRTCFSISLPAPPESRSGKSEE